MKYIEIKKLITINNDVKMETTVRTKKYTLISEIVLYPSVLNNIEVKTIVLHNNNNKS